MVDENKSKMSALDLTQAKRARALQRRMRRSTTCDYIHYISMNMIPNRPVTVIIQDIKNTEFSWGRDLLACVKGKSMQKISPKVRV